MCRKAKRTFIVALDFESKAILKAVFKEPGTNPDCSGRVGLFFWRALGTGESECLSLYRPVPFCLFFSYLQEQLSFGRPVLQESNDPDQIDMHTAID